jgi:cell division protein ZapE
LAPRPSPARPDLSPVTIDRLAEIDTELSLSDLVSSFVPTPRFARVSFENYRPTPSEPSQAAARDRLRHWVDGLNAPAPTGLVRFLPFVRSPSRPARSLYLDGGFGVGKTHLLAATYHAARVPKLYLSFAELTYTIIQMGLADSIAEFRKYDLICLDEFELDDIASTRMAATFLAGVMEGPGAARVVTTSNTPPLESGRGRFAAAEFRREIGQIAERFDVLRIEGEDYRLRAHPGPHAEVLAPSAEALRARFRSYVPSTGAKLRTTHADLLDHLARLHPIRYARLLDPLDTIFVEDLAPIRDQDQALRFVHLVDKMYDLRVGLAASSRCALPDLFAPEYRDRGYAKKYRRCLSRLHEVLAETAERQPGARP